MQVKELGHVVFFVRNLEKSVQFYGGVLGFPQIKIEMPQAAMFTTGRTHHELLLIEIGAQVPAAARGYRAGLYHIGLKVGDTLEELKAAKQELESAGVRILGMSDHYVTKSIYLLDPDDNEIEIYIDADPELWRKDPTAIAAPTRPLYL